MNNRTYARLLLFFASLLFLNHQPCLGAPTHFGNSGLISHPTAEILKEGTFALAIYFQNKPEPYFNSDHIWHAVFSVGVTPYLELSARGSVSTETLSSSFKNPAEGTDRMLNIHYLLLKEGQKSSFSLAVGMRDFYSAGNVFKDKKDEVRKYPGYYVVGTKTLKDDVWNIKASLGLGSSTLKGLFTGLKICQDKDFSYMADFYNNGYAFGVSLNSASPFHLEFHILSPRGQIYGLRLETEL